MNQLILYNVYMIITIYISCDMNRALSKNAEKCYDEIKTADSITSNIIFTTNFIIQAAGYIQWQ